MIVDIHHGSKLLRLYSFQSKSSWNKWSQLYLFQFKWNRTYDIPEQDHRFRSKRTCEANAAGESSSFMFTICVKSVPFDHFKLAYVVLDMAVKEFFKTHF